MSTLVRRGRKFVGKVNFLFHLSGIVRRLIYAGKILDRAIFLGFAYRSQAGSLCVVTVGEKGKVTHYERKNGQKLWSVKVPCFSSRGIS